MHIGLIAASALGLTALPEAQAQATKAVEHANVGVRITVPAAWDWSERPGGIAVNCAPKIESRPGMPGCYFVVQKSRLAAGQAAITDADRAKWKGWAVGEGLGRVFVSAKDVKLAGYDAHEILVREGKERNAALTMRLVVLIPDRHFVDVMHYAWWDDADQSAATRPAVRAALETMKPLK